ncbi:MAG: hypothetical protein AABW59_02805 [archaeon]
MEETLIIRGVALFATLAGIQQWFAQNVSLFDAFFLLLVAAFLISLEHDYIKYREKRDSPSHAKYEKVHGTKESPGEQEPSCSKPYHSPFLDFGPHVNMPFCFCVGF